MPNSGELHLLSALYITSSLHPPGHLSSHSSSVNLPPHFHPSIHPSPCLSRTVCSSPSSPTHPPPTIHHHNKLTTTTTTTDAFPSSGAFDVINATLQADAAERKDAVEKAKAIVAFTIKNADGKEESWYLDLKEKGEVGKGAAPQGGKADGESCPALPCPSAASIVRRIKLTVPVTLQLSDADFASLVAGKANAQRLFMGGKLKIKGNIMKATKMEPVLKKAQGKAKL